MIVLNQNIDPVIDIKNIQGGDNQIVHGAVRQLYVVHIFRRQKHSHRKLWAALLEETQPVRKHPYIQIITQKL